MPQKEQFKIIFGEFIKEKRKQNHLKQTELADLMGNNFQNISSLERGEINPTLYWTTQLAHSFNQKLSDFIIDFERFQKLKNEK